MKLLRSSPLSKPPAANGQDGPAYLRNFVERLSFERQFGTTANDRARDVIRAEFQQIFGDTVKVIGETQNVVIGNPETAEVLIGAHYDSVPGTPGADDNASAVAVMMRIASVIRDTNRICFVAFNGEEVGLAGSTEFVDLLSPQHALKQVHVLEMVGYRSLEPNSQRNPLGPLITGMPTVGDFIGIVSNDQKLIEYSIDRAGAIATPVVGTALPPNVPVTMVSQMAPHLLRSDHAPFWAKNIPAVMWTDTAEFRNENYHQATDTPETLDYDFMSDVADLIIEIVKDHRD